jgi:hypothetical protein
MATANGKERIMAQIVDFYNVRPNELKPGDVLVCIVTLHVGHLHDDQGKPMYRMYRCNYPDPQLGDGDIPQGSSIVLNTEEAARALFPVVGYAGLKPD